MTDERSERLRQRRKRSERNTRERASNQTQSGSKSVERTASEQSGDREDPETAEDSSREASVKEEQVGTYMYLPKTQAKDLKRLYNVLKAEYEFEFDDEFEKNRHFYPLVVQYGLESLDGMDASEIKERLEEM